MSQNGKCTTYKKNSRQKLHVRKRDLKTKKKVLKENNNVFIIYDLYD